MFKNLKTIYDSGMLFSTLVVVIYLHGTHTKCNYSLFVIAKRRLLYLFHLYSFLLSYYVSIPKFNLDIY